MRNFTFTDLMKQTGGKLMGDRLYSIAESVITLKSVFLISILCAILGAGFTVITNHESRLSRVETCLENLGQNAKTTQLLVLAIREDQITFYRGQNPKWKSTYNPQGEIFKP